MIRKFVLPLALSLTILVSACTPATAVPTLAPTPAPTATAEPTVAPAALTVTDGLNRTVTLSALPKRIVSLAASTTEVLFAVGAGAQVVGRDQNSDYPPDVKNVTDIGSTYQTLNSEAIVALKPDLVLAAGFNSPEEVKTLQDLGLTVYLFTNPVDFDGDYQDLTVTGQLTGHSQEAAALVNTLQTRVTAVTTKVKSVADKPLVYYEIGGSDVTKPWTSGPGTFMDAMLTLAGGRNIGATLKDPFAQISLEEIVKQDPDLIVLGDSLTGIAIESVDQRAGWAQLTAVKKGNVYAFDDSLASRPGPRLVDGLERLAKLLHPDLFK